MSERAALRMCCDRIPGTTASLEREAREALRTSLLDAKSARFEGIEARTNKAGSGGTMWAYAGFSRFVIDPAGNRKPTKAKSLDRVDGIVSAIMACGLAATDEGPKVYRGAGLAWV